ncbi:GH3 auxin-responsive promoter family protein [Hydrogenoanaerobacterium sp.]|uniref:GH3 family domain-containing protein n=1 Tax=Hydrogenoanaerobacterium sp. TaxID=2953763 RepID=UPI00289E0395|nr:GH3 auxin-responsive promoter family protein [Hydrogenoanaerobacterium sp.]
MNLKEKLKKGQYNEIWQEYCGFLDLDIEGYMLIQNRLMLEQIQLWSQSPLGKSVLGSKRPQTIDEFRSMIPLSTYGDYANILLQKRDDMLPAPAIVWIETTWEGGKHPVKVAPYTKGMLDTYRNNLISALILCTAKEKGVFDVKSTDKVLYGFAPLPYLTGLIPPSLNDTIGFEFLPPVSEAVKMSFSERNKKGFKLGLSKGIDFFFGMGSVAYYISQSVAEIGSGTSGGNKKSLFRCSPQMLFRLIRAKYRCKKEGRKLKPKDLFRLKGFVCAGTDNECYKDDLEDLWGIRPMELFAGTEPTCIGTETWNRNGLYLFPDACFYEFIPELEMNKSLEDESYQPQTVLMNEVVPGEKYELVISVFKGGAFVRYRVGDVYRCLGLTCREDKTKIPRFQYIDRVSSVIDIAGFTRITENSIARVIELSRLPVQNWFAAKEFTENKRPFLHLYVEIAPEALVTSAISKEILREHMEVYFKYVDNDYRDLKRILGIEPLEITIIRCGTFEEFRLCTGKSLRHINPAPYDVAELLRIQDSCYFIYRGGSL